MAREVAIRAAGPAPRGPADCGPRRDVLQSCKERGVRRIHTRGTCAHFHPFALLQQNFVLHVYCRDRLQQASLVPMRLLPSGRAVLRMNGVASRRLTSFLPLWRRCGQLVIQPQGFPRCNLHRLQPFTARCTASVLERDSSQESVHLLRRCFARAWLRCLTDYSSTRGHAHVSACMSA